LGSVVGIAVSVKLARKQWQSKIIEQTLQKEKADAELKFLKAQVSPHFLFNTLNNIYSLARKKSSLTAESIMKLSKLLRFMLYDAANQHILLTDELKLIEDYIELEKLRYNDRLKVTFIREIDNPSQRIAPLLLIHFVENAFKHGAGESRFDIKIQIEIKLTQSVLTARFYNTKGEIPKQDQDSNIGLHNLRRQLELLYPTHRLEINNQADQFIVELTIPLPQ
ncbi:MAG: sensor histidine kinase, partial [Cyclobacteriaceae bacterium]|nr:sensor histidine kinase [Cyclobacteriaceae bacterium]